MTETPDTSEVEETFEADEQGVAYRSESAPSDDAPGAPGHHRPGAATGRRKEAIARVRLVPGTGQWSINGRTLDKYFPNKLHQQVVNEPFVTADGGLLRRHRPDPRRRHHRPGRRAAPGHRPCAERVDAEASRPALKKAGLLTRDARVIERKKAGLKKARKAPQYSKR